MLRLPALKKIVKSNVSVSLPLSWESFTRKKGFKFKVYCVEAASLKDFSARREKNKLLVPSFQTTVVQAVLQFQILQPYCAKVTFLENFDTAKFPDDHFAVLCCGFFLLAKKTFTIKNSPGLQFFSSTVSPRVSHFRD